MRKRFLALALSGIMMILSSDMVFAADNTVSVEDIIIQQAVMADEVTDWSDYEFEVVEIQTEGINTRSVDSGENSGMKVLQTVNTEDGITTLTTLMPYKVVEDGELVNSFEYAENVSESRALNNFNNYEDTFTDVVVATSVEYEEVGSHYYRHGGVTSYWSCPSGTVSSIDRLFVSYRTYGMLYEWNGGLGDPVFENAWEVKSVIDRINPTRGELYSAYNRTSSNQVFQFGGDDLGSNISIQVDNNMPEIYNIR